MHATFMTLAIAGTVGLTAGLVLHAIIHLRTERIHASELRQEWEDGRKHGYHQCWREMVQPLDERLRPAPANAPRHGRGPRNPHTTTA